MTPEQIFEKVSRHLFLQNEKSLDHHGQCAYRGINGRMCAIGCLIPDELYTPYLEGRNLNTIQARRRMWELVGMPTWADQRWCTILTALNIEPTADNHLLLCSLQRVHDNYAPEDWAMALVAVAVAFNLSVLINLFPTQ